ncbi:hypothetical protein [Streptosporangium sp. NPDC006007]|uniref:hypothetical protein n=1 Tax=Streptosporangium sp. NPDC006007 TaxID=3154575 RepID=UPI0033B509EE
MAVPPIQPSRVVAAGPPGLVRPLRVSLMLDVVLGLLVAVTLPLAIVAIPNTISVVAVLLPSDISQVEMVWAHGLALPAMVLTVPLAGLLLRHVRAAPVLVGGLTLLALADAAGGYAGSTLLVGVLRVLHGTGAGLLVPATLVAVWGRPMVLRGIWGGVLAVSLLAAQALALWPLDEVRSWRVTLQPYPMLTGIALALAAAYLVLWMRIGDGVAAGPVPGAMERGRPLAAVVPAAGIAALALGATFDWPPERLVLVGGLSILVLLGVAVVTFEGVAGRAPAYTTLAVGVVVLPTMAQVTCVELVGLGGPGLSGLWPAFVVAGVAGLVAAVLVSRLGDALMPLLGAGGLVAVVAGLCSVRVFLPAPDGLVLILPFVLLTVGAAVALTAALRASGVGAQLFALSLFFPGVLSGFLLGGGIQVTLLQVAVTQQAKVDAFVGAMRLWALVAGVLVVVMIVLGAVLTRRSPAARGGTAGVLPRVELPPVEGLDDVCAEASPTGAATSVTSVTPAIPVVPPPARPVDHLSAPAGEREGEPGRAVPETEPKPKTGPRPRLRPGRRPAPEPEPDRPGALPVVPPPTPSPEGALGDGADRP